ncbi:MAG: DVU0298 family protein [Thermodesulfobacteriota bacterium]
MKISEKRHILHLLRSGPLEKMLAACAEVEARQLVNPLFSGICHADQTVRWHAVMAMGPTVARLADEDMEAARVVMRRFMWSLNDESGGIGWGATESMAEIMACHAGIAAEYCHILVSYMREDGSYLEYEPMQRGLLWAIARLAEFRRDLLLEKGAAGHLLPYLDSPDTGVRGLAAHGAGRLGIAAAAERLRALAGDRGEVALYLPARDRLVSRSVAELAAAALAAINAA